tara:strand:+ start:1301 stop:1921 length:621 start_codon:yes stop_codon:yes gene_type:complete
MISRKKKLRFIQLFLLILGILIIYNTYYNKDSELKNKIISSTTKEKVKKQSDEDSENYGNTFYNIEYTGLDLNGNRYILKSEEATLDKSKVEIVHMKIVSATFYFKDNTILYIWSDEADYNNKTFDMKFEKNVKAQYADSELFAEKAEFSNTNNYLIIHENVKINNTRGNVIADKLLFDITKKKLDISSFNNNKVNANINLNEKRF